MSVRGYKEIFRCPQCRAEVSQGDATCKNGHELAWGGAAPQKVATPAGTPANTPTTFLETKIDYGVFLLYVLIVVVLGAALWYSLSLGTGYMSFSSAIVTALTTIAGFAVGVNAGTPSSTPQQKK